MSKLGKKVTGRLDKAAEALVGAGAARGPKAMAVANTASRLFLGRYWVRCDDGDACTVPEHEHHDLRFG